MPEDATTAIVRVFYPLEISSQDSAYSVVAGQAFVDKGVVCRQKVSDREISLSYVVEEKLRLSMHRIGEGLVIVGVA